MWFFRRKKNSEGDQEQSPDEKPGILTVPEGHPTIQDAIDAAPVGSTVIVMPGRYREVIDFRGKDITVRSESPNDRQTVTDTVIDAEQRGTVVSFCNGESDEAKLAGFTLTGGRGDPYGPPSGGGVTVRNRSGPIIESNVIVANRSELDGGGICVDDSWPIISRNQILDNEAAGCGGGIHIGWDAARVEARVEPLAMKNLEGYLDKASPGGFGIATGEGESEDDLRDFMTQWESLEDEEEGERRRPRLDSNTIVGNEALSGGGLHVSDESPFIEGNVFRGNGAGRGGGVCFWDNSRPVVSGNHIVANEATEEGGGMIIEWGSAPALIGNRFSGNISGRDQGLSISQNSAPVVRSNQFDSSRCHAVFLWQKHRAILEGNTFEGGP